MAATALLHLGSATDGLGVLELPRDAPTGSVCRLSADEIAWTRLFHAKSARGTTRRADLQRSAPKLIVHADNLII